MGRHLSLQKGDQSTLRWFDHIDKMDKGRYSRIYSKYQNYNNFHTTVVWWYGTFQGLVTQMPAAALIEPEDLLNSLRKFSLLEPLPSCSGDSFTCPHIQGLPSDFSSELYIWHLIFVAEFTLTVSSYLQFLFFSSVLLPP